MAIDISVHNITEIKVVDLYDDLERTIAVKIKTRSKLSEVNLFFENKNQLDDLLMFALVNFACVKSGKTESKEK